MNAKRTPLVIDQFLATPPKKYRNYAKPMEWLQARCRGAKPFVLDREASVFVAEMVRDHPEWIARNLEFAIPPFAHMYVEFSYIDYFNTLGAVMERRDGEPLDQDMGLLYVGPDVYVMVRNESDYVMGEISTPLAPMPLRYKLNQPNTHSEQIMLAEVLGTSRRGLDAFYWGSVWPKLDEDEQRIMRGYHGCEVWYAQDGLRNNRLLTSCAGDLRNIIALPLFLNRTRSIQYTEEVGPHRTFIRAKPATLVRHHVIRIKLNPGPLLQQTFESVGRAWRREHDVRGHFCHDKTTRAHQHDHDWIEYDVNQWRCRLCSGLRWWRREHHRGKREVGQVKATYDVTE